jgi:X-Pro dipeptidyl-peptidase
VVLAMAAFASTAHAQTTPQYDYDGAIRERVYIPNGQDADLDGVEDRTAIEIMRPKESGPGTKVPAIVAPSPYYTADCGQFVGECIGDLDNDGVNDRWPLWYDNYFVPRGYAVILAEMDGTANSTGCAVNGGPSDVLSIKAVVDWLQGRIPGYKAVTGTADPVVSTWDNGKSAMIGRSYNGTLPNGVAATGVEGLTTLVPISAISSWYDYSRMGGVIGSTHYPAFLSNYVTDANRRAYCAPIRDLLSANDADADGTMNAFWDVRNYRPDVGKVKASVFVTHCLQDDNVKPNQFSEWWAGLAQHNVPRKLWICREGHIDPFMTRRAEWMNQLHKWFDHWLYGVQNGIMSEPRASIEREDGTYQQEADWPAPGTRRAKLYLSARSATAPGDLSTRPGRRSRDQSFVDRGRELDTDDVLITNPDSANPNRLVYRSPELRGDLRISGTPWVTLRMSIDNRNAANLTAVLVDYGPAAPVMVTRGWLDPQNRYRLDRSVPIRQGREYSFRWDLQPDDYVWQAGHRIGLVVVSTDHDYTIRPEPGTELTLDPGDSDIRLPIVGGASAFGF